VKWLASLIILAGCAHTPPEYEDAIHLRPKNPTPWSQAKEEMCANALRDWRTGEARKAEQQAHMRKMRSTSTTQPSYLLPSERHP